MADGAVARKTGTVSEFGSRLDTIADIVFVVVCMIKLIPVLNIPLWLFIWIAIIALIKIINILSGLVAAHTVMNKVTGIVLFILPLTQRGSSQCGGDICCDTGRALYKDRNNCCAQKTTLRRVYCSARKHAN